MNQYSQIMLGVKGDWPTTPAMWVTEHNALTNAVWIKKACSTDSAKESTMAAAQAMGLAAVGGEGEWLERALACACTVTAA